MKIPDGYVPNKTHVAQLVHTLKSNEWTALDDLLKVPHWNPGEIRMCIDVLHYAGILRSMDDSTGLHYQWRK